MPPSIVIVLTMASHQLYRVKPLIMLRLRALYLQVVNLVTKVNL